MSKIVVTTTVDLSLYLLEGFPEGLVDRGWEVHLVTAPGPRLERFATTPGVKIHALPMKRQPSLLSDIRSLVLWWALLRRIRPDAIAAGTPKASLLALVAGMLAGVPYRQYLVRGLRMETVTGVRHRILAVTEKLCVFASTDVIAISESLRGRMVSLGLTGRKTVDVIGAGSSNGIDLVRFDPEAYPESSRQELAASLGVNADIPVVGYVGRLANDKGIFDLLASSQDLVERGVQVQVLLVGWLEDQDVMEAVEAARRTGLRVLTSGPVENAAPYLTLMDVFCMPSRREGFGNAALEASAMEVPVVATAVTGLVDAVEDGVTGLLSEPHDIRQLVHNLERLLQDPDFARSMGLAGRARARAKFDRRLVQKQYMDRLEPFKGAHA